MGQELQGSSKDGLPTTVASSTKKPNFKRKKSKTALGSTGPSRKSPLHGASKKPISGQIDPSNVLSSKQTPYSESEKVMSSKLDVKSCAANTCSEDNTQTIRIDLRTSNDTTLGDCDKYPVSDNSSREETPGESNPGPSFDNEREVETLEKPSRKMKKTKKLSPAEEVELLQFKQFYDSLISSETRFECEVCNQVLSSKFCLQRHLLTHSDLKPYKCSLCEKSFISNPKLKEHHRNVHDETNRGFPCEYCEKVFKNKSYKKAHVIAKHKKNSRFTCSFDRCSFAATCSNSLERHIRTHTGEKPFLCHHCDFRAACLSNLTRHISSRHTNEKPYKCTFCTYASSDKRKLTIHLRRHTGERPYSCENCQSRFTQKSHLQKHLKTSVCVRTADLKKL